MKKYSFLILTLILFAGKVSALESIWYYTETPDARKSLFANISKIDILAPQVYELQMGGTANSVLKDDIVNLAKNNHVKVMPLLANTAGKAFNQKTVLDLIDNTDNWEKISVYMRQQAYNNNFYGWQLDLENIPVGEKQKFNQMVAYLKGELAKDNLILSVAVVAKISDNKKDYDLNYWNNWAGAYDYKTLASSTDFLSVMAYDQPQTQGPVADISWSKKVLNYSLQNIPADKISFGIPAYSVAYLSSTKKRMSIVPYSFAYKWITFFDKSNRANMTTGAGISKIFGNISWISYNQKGINYTIWYEDKNSFATKLAQIKNARVRGFSVWVLGDEDPAIWKLF